MNLNSTTNTTVPSPSFPPPPRNIAAFLVALVVVALFVTFVSYLCYKCAANTLCSASLKTTPFQTWSPHHFDLHRLTHPRPRTQRLCPACNTYTVLAWRGAIFLFALVFLSVRGADNPAHFRFLTVLTWLLFTIVYALLVGVSIAEIRGYNALTSTFARVLSRMAGFGFVIAVQNSMVIDVGFYALLSWNIPADRLYQFSSLVWHGPINLLILLCEIWIVDMPYEMSYLTVPWVPIIVYWLGWSVAFLVVNPTDRYWFPYWFFNFTWLLPMVIVGIMVLSTGLHALCVVVVRKCGRCCGGEETVVGDRGGGEQVGGVGDGGVEGGAPATKGIAMKEIDIDIVAA